MFHLFGDEDAPLRSRLCRPKVFEFSDDIWDAVLDFLCSDVLSQVCRVLRHVFGGRRFVKWTCNTDRAIDIDRLIGLAQNVRSLQLAMRGSCRPTREVAILKTAPHLHTLVIDYTQSNMGSKGAVALAALKDACSLHTVSLELAWMSIGDSGAEALAAFKDAALLHTLTLDLRCAANCHVGWWQCTLQDTFYKGPQDGRALGAHSEREGAFKYG